MCVCVRVFTAVITLRYRALLKWNFHYCSTHAPKKNCVGRSGLDRTVWYSVDKSNHCCVCVCAAFICFTNHLLTIKYFTYPLSATILMLPLMMIVMIVIADFTHAHSTYVCMVYICRTWPLFFRIVIQFPIRYSDGFIFELSSFRRWVFVRWKNQPARTSAAAAAAEHHQLQTF